MREIKKKRIGKKRKKDGRIGGRWREGRGRKGN